MKDRKLQFSINLKFILCLMSSDHKLHVQCMSCFCSWL